MRQPSRWLFAIVLGSSLRLCAQSEPDPCALSASQPGDISLQLSLQNGQNVFREGEIIALSAAYSSTSEKKYYANTRNYDRSGRLQGAEIFCIDPAAGTDPLADYFNGGMACMMGGLSGEKQLGPDPYIVNLELNEWKSLPPGSYRLSIVGHRVTVPAEGSPSAFGGTAIPLRSNEVQFQVIKADPEWQAQQLAAAQRALDSPDAEGTDAKHAARVLRFLGSEAATREMACRFWAGNDQPFGWDLKFGLFGSPYRAVAIENMKAALKDPQHPVTNEFVQTLALLELQSDPKSQLPKYDEKNKEAWTKLREAHTEAFNKLIASHMSDLAGVLDTKTGQARAVSVNELLQSDAGLSPAAGARLRQMLVASWDALPVRRQNELIRYRWDQIGGRELLPILQRIVNGEPNRNHQIDKTDRAPALTRIYEVASGEGRELILREIANPRGDIGIDVLGMLPERELPQIERPILTKISAGNAAELDYQLLGRYASARALPEIKALYEAHQGPWGCTAQDAMLRYFLRVSFDYGVAQLRDALGQRKDTGCYKVVLSALNEDIRRPRIEQIAIAALDDPSPEVVRNAAESLQRYGSARAEAALLARLQKFHEQWKDKTEELHYRPGMKPEELAEIGLEQVLIQAITDAQAWLTTENTIHKLKELASPQRQSELDGVLSEIQRGEYGLYLGWWPDGPLTYNVGRYSGRGIAALKEKLAQLPSGTHLNLITTVAERQRHEAEFAEVERTAAANGLLLQIQTPR